MQASEQLIHKFYSSFQEKDYQAMQHCYADTATFSDPVFRNLDATRARAMWEMFCKRGKDMQLTYSIQQANENTVQAIWIPDYTFSATGRHVTNYIHSTFTIENNKIVTHRDRFNFYKWSRQALGASGWLLGWTPFLQNKVRATANNNLDKFIESNKGN
jgi:limonene-1,2-epoxide hydrolase